MLENQTRSFLLRCGVLVCVAFGTAACMSGGAEPPTSDEVTVESSPDGALRLNAGASDEAAVDIPDGTPGEAADASAEIDKARNCVYIQWCNEPGPNGTICRRYGGCPRDQAAIDECIADAYYVCGSPIQPWYLY